MNALYKVYDDLELAREALMDIEYKNKKDYELCIGENGEGTWKRIECKNEDGEVVKIISLEGVGCSKKVLNDYKEIVKEGD